MYGIYDLASGDLQQVVVDLDGHDLAGCGIFELAADWFDTQVWDAVQRCPVPAPITPRQVAAKKTVDASAAQQRASRLTDGFGQEMLYLQKEAEARACLAATAPEATAYPLLAAEIGITGASLAEVAVAVIIRADECRAEIAAIEAVRLSAKQQITAATSRAEIDTILASINWPS